MLGRRSSFCASRDERKTRDEGLETRGFKGRTSALEAVVTARVPLRATRRARETGRRTATREVVRAKIMVVQRGGLGGRWCALN